MAKLLGVRPQELARAWVTHARMNDTEFIPWGINPTRGKNARRASYNLKIRVINAKEWQSYVLCHIAKCARQVAELAFETAFGKVPEPLRGRWHDVDVPEECWDVRREGNGYAHHTVREACRALRDRLAAKGGWAVWSCTDYAYDSDRIAAVEPAMT